MHRDQLLSCVKKKKQLKVARAIEGLITMLTVNIIIQHQTAQRVLVIILIGEVHQQTKQKEITSEYAQASQTQANVQQTYIQQMIGIDVNGTWVQDLHLAMLTAWITMLTTSNRLYSMLISLLVTKLAVSTHFALHSSMQG